MVARGGTLYYPISLSYATGMLENAGHKVRLIDAIARSWTTQDVLQDASDFRPDLIVVDSNFSSLRNDAQVASLLKERTGATSVLVGPPTSQFPDRILGYGVDIVARNEYDATICQIADELEHRRNDLTRIRGISYQTNGQTIHSENRPPLDADGLDGEPFVSEVYKRHLDLRSYFLNHAFYPMVQIFAGRGCPNSCTFCSWPQTFTGRELRVRSVANVADEFEYVSSELKVIKEIFIEDDTFPLGRTRMLRFCEELRSRGVDISWGCQSRPTLDFDTMKSMSSAGCRLMVIGYESANDDILRRIRKGTTVQQLRKFTKDAKRAGIHILADFVIGFSGETKETAESTIRFIKEVRPDLVQVAVATPIPGTEFFKWCKENGYLLTENMEESISDEGYQRSIVSYPWLTNHEIEEYVKRALREYYISTSYFKVALRNVLSKDAVHESRLLLKSATAFLGRMGESE